MNNLVESQAETYFGALHNETSMSYNLFLKNNEAEFRRDNTMVISIFNLILSISKKGLLKQASYSILRRNILELKKIYTNYPLV